MHFSHQGSKRAKGIIQWVSEPTAVKAEVRLYDRLFTNPSPGKDHEDGNFLRDLNPESIKIISDALLEPSLLRLKPGEVMQFERLGYFVVDRVDNKAGDAANEAPLKFNRIVTLKVK
jgi:glutaminyl-tRNA synthetase